VICPACHAESDDAKDVCPSCGQSLRGHALGPGAVVAGRYEIRGTLGRGGMGTVFEARDRSLEETVALKMLRADVARVPDLERRFRSEIKLARRVRHRNVCGIHEYGEDGPLRYIAMERVEGTDLKAWLRAKGALPSADAYATWRSSSRRGSRRSTKPASCTATSRRRTSCGTATASSG